MTDKQLYSLVSSDQVKIAPVERRDSNPKQQCCLMWHFLYYRF